MDKQQPPRPPIKPNDPQSESPGFNWRVLILFVIAFGILAFAIMSSDGIGSKKLTYDEFEDAYKMGQVEVGNDNKPLILEIDAMGQPLAIRGFVRTDAAGKDLLQPSKVDESKVFVSLTPDAISDLFEEQVLSKAKLVDTAEPFSELKPADAKEMTADEFRKKLLRGEVSEGTADFPLTLYRRDNGQAILIGTQVNRVYPPRGDADTDPKLKAFSSPVPTFKTKDELKNLLYPGVEVVKKTNWVEVFFIYGLPIFFILIIFMFFRSQMKGAGKGAMNFGKSKARLLSMERNRITFNDVAGIQEAKDEVTEIVDFLKDPKKFQALGGSIPKGVLMVGSPGTGKTLLARAIAGEADVPFFSISGSDFVEMFVGVGASRVRDMFEQGRKHAPCIIFIDEIDAVGRHRGHGVGGGHDEREQTLNALLVEMDGFDAQEGVIIIAATNRPDVLDPALLRPGRFDRQVTVPLPDLGGREQILGVHVKKVKLAEGVDLEVIARGTPGFSGAELANLVNEAALLAARSNLTEITLAELEEARDKVRWGRERRSMALSEKEKEVTAYHEAGHALLLATLEHTDPLHKVTIIPRGPYLGAAFHLPKEEKFHFRKREGLEQLVVTMGGRVAEEIVFGDVTSGASGDIKQATNLARKMVCEWGMSDELGMVEYGNNKEEVFLARDMGGDRNYSEATAVRIDAEIKRLVDNAYNQAMQTLTERRDQLEAIAKGLLEYETLSASHIDDLLEFGEMKNPPKMPPSNGTLASGDTDEVPVDSQTSKNEDDGELPGDVVGQPA